MTAHRDNSDARPMVALAAGLVVRTVAAAF
jgi:hypothetical protein